jgi:predicted small lipoprotein YifL
MRPFDRRLARLALFGALGAALVLAGCGRKSGLDPPPSASVPTAPPQAEPGAAPAPQDQALPPGTRALRKRIPLDPLLD